MGHFFPQFISFPCLILVCLFLVHQSRITHCTSALDVLSRTTIYHTTDVVGFVEGNNDMHGYFTNSSGFLRRINLVNDIIDDVTLDLSKYGRPYFLFLHPNDHYLYAATGKSFLISIDTSTWQYASSINLQSVIPEMYMGGVATTLSADGLPIALLTGKYAVVAVQLDTMKVLHTVPLSTEPLCGTASTDGKYAYFAGSNTSRTGPGSGFVYKVNVNDATLVSTAEIANGYWPFSLSISTDGSTLTVVSTATISHISLDSFNVSKTIPTKGSNSELACFAGDVAYVAGNNAWNRWNTTSLQVVSQLPGLITTAQHSCAASQRSPLVYFAGTWSNPKSVQIVKAVPS